MMPYIHIAAAHIPTFPLCVVAGVLAMFLLIAQTLKRVPHTIDERNYIFPCVAFSGLIGFFSAGLFDSLVKFPLTGEFKMTGITFYGGLLGGMAALYGLLKVSARETRLSVKAWFDLLTVPFMVFHIFGRMGCFFGGCCYGKPTDSFIGVVFPDNLEQGIIHNGIKRFPTQLFEVAALVGILLLVTVTVNRFENYLMLYAVARFIIEFFRGDIRGAILPLFSPSQVVSLVLFIAVITAKCRRFAQMRRRESR